MHAQRLVFRFETDTVCVYRGALAVTAYGSRAVTPPDAWYSRKCMANRERPPVTRFVHRGRPARLRTARAQTRFGSPRDERVVDQGMAERSRGRT